MAAITTPPASIQKEVVPYLRFPKEDVLSTTEERKTRQERLNYATVIGNIDHAKVVILFEDVHGLKRIETTIWATTDESIVLKRGTIIPIHSIVDVEFV